MKTLTRLFVVALLLVSALAVVNAQDDDLFTAPDDILGTLVQNASSGTLTADADGNFTLTLNAVPEFGLWIVNAPYFYTSLYPTEQFALDWAFGEEVSGSAVLTLEDSTVEVTLNSVELIDDNLAFGVEVTGGTGVVEGKSGALEVPESFTDASLAIVLDSDFVTALIRAKEARVAGTRNTGCVVPFPPC